MSQKITPCLWFDDHLDEAVEYYAKVFKGKIVDKSTWPDGRLLTAHIDMLGTIFMLLAGNPRFAPNETTSFYIACKDQADVDYYWNRLVGDGGEESMCGWCRDKFGVSWQVVPDAVNRTIAGPDAAGRGRAMEAMMKMRKLIAADLEKAYAG